MYVLYWTHQVWNLSLVARQLSVVISHLHPTRSNYFLRQLKSKCCLITVRVLKPTVTKASENNNNYLVKMTLLSLIHRHLHNSTLLQRNDEYNSLFSYKCECSFQMMSKKMMRKQNTGGVVFCLLTTAAWPVFILLSCCLTQGIHWHSIKMSQLNSELRRTNLLCYHKSTRSNLGY